MIKIDKNESIFPHPINLANPSTNQAKDLFAKTVIDFWIRGGRISSHPPLFTAENWTEYGKELMPRILLAALLSEDTTLIEEANKYIQTLDPWTIPKTTWKNYLFSHEYDDFSITILTTILWKFGKDPSILHPETKKHLLHHLLKFEGGEFHSLHPGTFGLISDTENHILMISGSKYLKNRWISTQEKISDPAFDNVQNGLEEKLVDYLEKIEKNGLSEFNSRPYIGYTLTALLNLHDFGSEKVQAACKKVLDLINYSYILSSCDFKRFPPFMRQTRYEKETSLIHCAQSVYMKTWLNFYDLSQLHHPHMHKHALLALHSSYQLPAEVLSIADGNFNNYSAKICHSGKFPEIYFAGKTASGEKFLLSAGGVTSYSLSDLFSEIVTRPITLLLEGTGTDLSDTFYLAEPSAIQSPGSYAKKRNNTGVYHNFACASCPVHVPTSARKIESLDDWELFEAKPDLFVAVYSKKDLGILALFPQDSPEGILSSIKKLNPNPSTLKKNFFFPNGKKLSYDTNASNTEWVISHENDIELERTFSSWPLMQVTLESDGKSSEVSHLL